MTQSAAEASAVRQIRRRVLPLLFTAYFAAYVDRVNVGFAALTMNKALGLSAQQFGLAAGLFFAGYVAFGVPSNLVLARLGARRWIALILALAGLASFANAFVMDAHSFYLVRFLLGLCEAGVYPGLLYLCSQWFPARHRVRMLTLLILSMPVSIMLGSLISQPILALDGARGLAGWQWLFVVQALPTVALGVAIFLLLPDGPQHASWLGPEEKTWLITQLASERAGREAVHSFSVGQALADMRVWLMGIAGIGINAAVYGLILFLPQIIHALGVSTSMTPLVNAIPYGVAAVAMVLWGAHSDRSMERFWHAASAAALAGLALVACTLLHAPLAMLAALCVGIAGIFCYVTVFWAVPSSMLTGPAAAAGLALINTIANLGSLGGPYALGWVKGVTGSFDLGIMALGLGPLMAAGIALSLRGLRRFEIQTSNSTTTGT